MKNLSNINTIKDVLSRNGFSFSKSLGQNFLINPTVCPKMAEMGGADSGVGVIEIGAGIGVLTAELAQLADKVVSIEIDKRLMPVLNETLEDFDNIEIVNADVMDIDLHSLIKEKFEGLDVVVCANLPYYITSPIIMMLLESKLPIKSITVMVQKEAADRLCAQVGSREAGAVTVAVNYYAQAYKLFDVPRGSFMPSPNVDSKVIKLDVRETPEITVDDESKFFKMVKAAFAQRRKTALNSISSGLSMQKSKVGEALEKSGLPLNIRAEKLTMEQLATLSNNL